MDRDLRKIKLGLGWEFWRGADHFGGEEAEMKNQNCAVIYCATCLSEAW